MNILTILYSTGINIFYILGSCVFAVAVVNLMILLTYVKRAKRREEELEEKILLRTEELITVINELNLSQKTLQQQADFQKKMIAAIVHGIKSPLKYLALTGRQLYNRNDLSGKVREVANGVYTSSQHLYVFTDNLLQYVKVYLRESKPVPAYFFLHALVQEKLAVFQDIATEKKSVLNNHIHPNMQLFADERLLSIIIHNLVDNAVKFTSGGAITISAFMENDLTYIAVQDTGIGINDEMVEQLYYGEEISSGLGITIVRQLLELINGKLEIRSREGEGTVAIISLPIQNMVSVR
ncbi:Signal transduction histidine kinase [Filimonas lacunae]|uniref:histidine kinase n=1 Tax=Filimonas lacunae TaxID=477680 RepID=A0A173MKU2_9BACT|nr:HAMP domain-containing sensor histidine kinase [Filimonas lacunae]BAV08021.1 sensor histidine kinase [Filimonas lacunae]SIT08099.1 Signal transduction histidine kinase [Filimonas lacunae]